MHCVRMAEKTIIEAFSNVIDNNGKLGEMKRKEKMEKMREDILSLALWTAINDMAVRKKQCDVLGIELLTIKCPNVHT